MFSHPGAKSSVILRLRVRDSTTTKRVGRRETGLEEQGRREPSEARDRPDEGRGSPQGEACSLYTKSWRRDTRAQFLPLRSILPQCRDAPAPRLTVQRAPDTRRPSA